MKRKIEIVAFENSRIHRYQVSGRYCDKCGSSDGLVTTAEAAEIARVSTATIRRWVANGGAHGTRTAGGNHRVCVRSLFKDQLERPEDQNETKPDSNFSLASLPDIAKRIDQYLRK
jgi:excisionase family DNA binding protein